MPDTAQSSIAAATTKRAFAQDDNFKSKHVGDAVVAADGSVFYQLFETVGDAASETERKRSTIWRVDPETAEKAEITGWAANAMSPAISGDGSTLYFLASTDKAAPPQLHRLVIKSGALNALTSLETGVTMFAVSPGNDRIALAAVDPEAKKRKPKAHTRIKTLVYRFDSLPGYLQDAPQALHVMPAGGGEEPKAISPYDGLITAIRWSPEGGRIAYVVNGHSGATKFAMAGDLYVTDVKGERKLIREAQMAMSPEWTPDGRGIMVASAPEDSFAKQWQLYLVDAATGAESCRTAQLDRSVPGTFQVTSPSGSGAMRFVVENDQSVISTIAFGGQGAICRIALSGEESVEPILRGDFIARPLALAGRKLLYSKQDLFHPAELWIMDLDGNEDRALTDHNEGWQAEIAWPALERVEVENEGMKVEGWVMKPAGGKAPFPGVLYIHGGPHAAFGHGYCEDIHEMVGAGYAVLFANPRGSTHYGDAFSTAIIERWGHPEHEDFMAMLDDLVARKIIDPDRLGVTGVSGGGHLTAWLMTHTDRFKAAIPEQGVYSMISMYGVSDAGADLIALEMGGHPHEQPERYWALSPVAHAHSCKTPTLLIQGENDIRCPMEQAEQLYAILKINGCETEFLRLDNCKHGTQMIEDPSLRRVRMDAIKDWLGRYL
ncbi:S9 family peptidase [Sphingosinicella rhizophila]|uniref:S9 family peptidase n=1 Tax=Sphingosinicella rhizophila TaxID=3050082 RepID=A0ABU3QAN8_9SPHN|nr:S9 family peptidase [Sphingosinicella sp. GR2756]MDT9600199.1 S9 family peptidase [Sphingosinicella sp. GR2756]